MNFQGGTFVSNPKVYRRDNTKVNKPSLNADLSPDPPLHCNIKPIRHWLSLCLLLMMFFGAGYHAHRDLNDEDH